MLLRHPRDRLPPAVEATETSETVTFLGKAYARKEYTVSQRHQSNTELTYRGVRYTA